MHTLRDFARPQENSLFQQSIIMTSLLQKHVPGKRLSLQTSSSANMKFGGSIRVFKHPSHGRYPMSQRVSHYGQVTGGGPGNSPVSIRSLPLVLHRGRVKGEVHFGVERLDKGLQALGEGGDILGDDLPDDVEVHVEVAVDEPIPGGCDLAPGDFGMLFFEVV